MNYDELLEGDELPVEALALPSDFVRAHAAELGMEAGRFSSREEALAEGLPDQILPGVMSMGLLARLLLRSCPGARVTRIGTTFRGLVVAEQKASLHAMITEKNEPETTCEVDLWLQTESGERNVVGTATLDFRSLA
ncbi:MAG: hypothetical protein P8R45_09980 [Candidatus Binatia bacterium]|nr:hypothetical protein [Candidatus Binatia bacterium]